MNKDEFFMDVALAAKKQSTCNRLKVGACLTDGRYVLSTGWNGTIKGETHCCDIFPADFLKTAEGHAEHHKFSERYEIHAEINAMLNTSSKGTVMYVTTAPCNCCLKQMAAYGIKEVVYKDEYDRYEFDKQYAVTLGLKVRRYDNGIDN